MTELLFKDECYKIVGACFNVYNTMGCGFLEGVYQECLQIELEFQQIPATEQPNLRLHYRERELKQRYVPDFICYDKIILELKAVSQLCDEHRSQVLNYLNATSIQFGILINFGHHPGLEYERIVLQHKMLPANHANLRE